MDGKIRLASSVHEENRLSEIGLVRLAFVESVSDSEGAIKRLAFVQSVLTSFVQSVQVEGSEA